MIEKLFISISKNSSPSLLCFFFPLSEEKIKTNPKIVINMILPKKSYHCGILLLLYRDRIKESVSRI